MQQWYDNAQLLYLLSIPHLDRDGLIDVVRGPGPRTEDEDFDRNFYTARGQLLLLPTEALDIRLSLDYTERDEICCAAPQALLAPSMNVPWNVADPSSPCNDSGDMLWSRPEACACAESSPATPPRLPLSSCML